MSDPTDTTSTPPPGDDPLASLTAEQRAAVDARITQVANTTAANVRRAYDAKAAKSAGGATPPAAAPSFDASTVARRVASFMQAGYSADEAHDYGVDLGIAVPPPPPRGSSAAPPPGAARQPTAPAPVITDNTPIMSMSVSDRLALTAKIGEKAFAERWRAELKGVRIKPQQR